jgi:hypothetical protein
MTTRRSDRLRKSRGQAIVLMAFTAAFLAFTVLTTLAIGRAVRERIQIQNAADASAYSLAVQEARAFNFYAYTNRAIVAHFVLEMSEYGHMSYLAYWEGVLQTIANQWGCDCENGDWWTSIQGQETIEWAAWCAACLASLGTCGICCSNCAGDSGDCVPNDYDYIDNNICQQDCQTLQNVDQDLGKSGGSSSCFGSQSSGLTMLAWGHNAYEKSIVASQSLVDANLQAAFLNQSMTSQIAKQFDKNYGVGSTPELAGALNVIGVPGDDDTAGYCARGGGTKAGPVTSLTCSAFGGGGLTSESTQQQAANAARYGPGDLNDDWLGNRPDGIVSTMEAYIVAELVTPGEHTTSLVPGGTGMTRETVSSTGNPPPAITQGDTSQGGCSGHNCGSKGGGSWGFSAEDHGNLTSFDIACISDITLGFRYDGIQTYAYSVPKNNPNGSQSTIGWSDGSKTQTDDYDIGGCSGPGGKQCGVGVASINYNPDSAAAALFNQPHTWAIVTKSFNYGDLTSPVGSTTYGTADEGPFAMKRQLSLDGKNSYNYNNGITLPASDPDYTPGREAMYAIAQGLAYYHRPGNWQEEPNFYNPYWRAKLQPVEMAGGSNPNAGKDIGAAMAAAGYPAAESLKMGAAVAAGLFPVTE